jgi:hypothetical protein
MLYGKKSATTILETSPLGDGFDVAKLEHLLKHLHSQPPSNLKTQEFANGY